MSKFWLITKINILNFFNIKSLNNSKNKNNKKSVFKGLLILFIILYIAWYIYFICKEMMPTFIVIGKPIYLLALLFTASSLYILYANIFKIKSTLFDFKDYDLLMSLPIKRNIVITSKIASLYILNLIYALIVMIPGYIAYISYADLPCDILYFILILTIPIVPILISSIIGILLAWLTSFIKNKNIGSYIIYISMIIFAFFISYSSSGMDSEKMTTGSINLVNTFSRYYPLTNNYINLLESFKILDLVIYFGVPIVLAIIFVLLINKVYIGIRTRLLRTNVKRDYVIKTYNYNNSLISLYKKELKRYLSCPIYVINTAFGCILLLMMIVALLLFNDNTIGEFMQIPNFSEQIKNYIFMIMSMACVMSCTTNSSISLEGKSLWIIKMLPVNVRNILLSKIMVNLTLLVPTVIISGTFFGIYLHLNMIEFLIIYLMPLAYAIFISLMGVVLNLMFPRFDYESEIKVVKQSMAVFLSILIGFIVVFVPGLLHDYSISYFSLVTLIIYVINVILYIGMNRYSNNKFIKL